MKRGYCVLETGEIYQGEWLGGASRAGEVVFNTSHSGYEEIATDPSYYSQIVVMTAPMMGNYGVSRRFWESSQLWIQGFVCLQMQSGSRDQAWLERLRDYQIPVLSGIDTRKLTHRLRQGGTPWGAIVQAENEGEAIQFAKTLINKEQAKDKDWVHAVSRRNRVELKGDLNTGLKIGLIDYGCKENILRELLKRSKEIVVFPSRVTVAEIESANIDKLFLSNGPGNPEDVLGAPEVVKAFLGRLPVMGICMGHQILGLSLGAKTYKLKFGHRGANHPIRDDLIGKVYISSQNHGYAVDSSTLPDDIKVTQTNLNDQTVAGIFSESRRCLGIQYHPESHPGPHDAVALFDYFIERL